MAQRSAETNWLINADNVTKSEENFFLSKFGELKKDGLHKPYVEHHIVHAVVSFSYYEHSERRVAPFL